MTPTGHSPFLATVVTMTLFGGSAGASGARPAYSMLSLQVSLQATRICVGEPIVLTYSVRNLTLGDLDVDPVGESAAWLRLGLMDGQGKPVAGLVDRRPGPYGDQFRVSAVRHLAVGQSLEGDCVVSRTFAPQAAGTYRLEVTARLSAAATGGTWIRDALVQRRSFALTVVPADHRRLQRVAVVLAKHAAAEKNMEHLRICYEALFGMPAADALPSWQSVASSPECHCKEWAIEELVRAGSAAAADVVALIAASPEASELAEVAKGALRQIHETGEPAARVRVEQIMGTTGGQLPRPPGRASR